MPIPEEFRTENTQPAVRGFLHQPGREIGHGLVLTHGAGANSNTPLLVALAEAFSSAGFTVLRCDLPFRQNKPSGPPMGTASLDQAGLRNAVLEMKKLVSGKVFLGGHSYGGRQSTMLCANEPGLVEGLLLLSYPLHPPRKPDQLRTQHFPKLQTPSLFVHGTRDPFGSVEEMQEAQKLIAGSNELLPIEGAGHDLGLKGNSRSESLISEISQTFLKFFQTFSES
jgi:uncharacterized protein